MRLQNKTAIVTGAASGIGWASVNAFLQHGASVALFDISLQRLQQQLDTLDDTYKDRSMAFEVDVTDSAGVTKAVKSANEHFGHTQLLVNCAAAQTPAASVEDLPLEEWTIAFAVNVTGTYLVSKAVLPYMRAAGAGSIIHIASQLGSVGMPGFGAYCSTKGALLQLTRTMALEHAKDNIRVNSVSPGATLTERLRRRFGSDQAAFDALGGGYPMGRLGTPDEIANGVVFLASDEASFVTGTDLVIDGGYLAQ